MAPLRCAAKFDPFLSLDCAPTPSTLAQSKERKGSNFAIWQPHEQGILAKGAESFTGCIQDITVNGMKITEEDVRDGKRDVEQVGAKL